MTPRPGVDLLVVGAGFAGLYALHAARTAGLSVRCLEAADGIGGTWYHNRYPGCRCDVESIDYSYSFDPGLQDEWEWSERYATQPEILAYIEHVADRFDLHRDIELGTRVESARFDEAASEWTVRTSGGEAHRAQYVVLATGALSDPVTPDLPGVHDFAGTVLHTAQWPAEEPDLHGKRIGVIGTGSSGIQAVPELAERAAELTVFQRTANYSVPAFNRPLTAEDQERIRAEYPERRAVARRSGGGSPHEAHPRRTAEVSEAERQEAFERTWRTGGVLFSKTFPDQMSDLEANGYARRFFEAKLAGVVEDPRTLDDLTPKDHPIGAKRICTDSGYYAAFNRDHVHLVNLRREPLTRVTPDGVATDRAHYDLDVLVFATGFDALTGTLGRMDVRGPGGATLADAWSDGPLTYLGMHVPGLPNLFLLNGPGSPAVLANMVLTSEQQVDWVVDLVAGVRERGATQVEARADAARAWNEHVAELADRTLFPQADSWYVGANVEGKKRTFMLYAGGLGTYTRVCDQVRDEGYPGLVLTSRAG
ncbi:NAD(P)/FAD-dependent oxidoreductase [Nocardiopsis sp. HNM0947]|uniref:NAD(P)/FAD-dependent oxidoreductase n=1 Tax=Nocardiopsis coralli TaxID=2772213 RepID=A0ABR9P224_9ACTN|nr:NAD(P)/FAD-dependent oxidoreductase [Nocardiopsis coralli]MBE2997906.1 NAD(P)/FAD-dependent oxidoreductase [Nocardiopsis coralli]